MYSINMSNYHNNRRAQMNDWGEIKLERICEADDFWHLIWELCEDSSDYLQNKSAILDAYTCGNLYGLRVDETKEMRKFEAGLEEPDLCSVFCTNSRYLIPCFCVKENNKAIMIWTHKKSRQMGFATKLVSLLQIEYAVNPSASSEVFWEKRGVKLECLKLHK